MNNKFSGVYPAMITPMTADGQLNEDVFRQVMEFNIQAGVHGFWLAGGTGESVLLDDEENRRIAEIAVDQAQGRIKNIMHVGTPTTARSARLAEHAAKCGVDAICCVPPFFYSQSNDAIVEHYRVVATAADLPLFVYNLPQSTQVEITPASMREIQEKVPHLEGLKHSAPNMNFVRHFSNMGLACLIGNCRLMLPALTVGAIGCIDGPPNMAPELWVAVWDAFQAGDFKEAMVAQEKCAQVATLAETPRFPTVIKAVISERLGVDCGNPRPPYLSLSPSEQRELSQKLRSFGLVN